MHASRKASKFTTARASLLLHSEFRNDNCSAHVCIRISLAINPTRLLLCTSTQTIGQSANVRFSAHASGPAGTRSPAAGLCSPITGFHRASLPSVFSPFFTVRNRLPTHVLDVTLRRRLRDQPVSKGCASGAVRIDLYCSAVSQASLPLLDGLTCRGNGRRLLTKC